MLEIDEEAIRAEGLVTKRGRLDISIQSPVQYNTRTTVRLPAKCGIRPDGSWPDRTQFAAIEAIAQVVRRMRYQANPPKAASMRLWPDITSQSVQSDLWKKFFESTSQACSIRPMDNTRIYHSDTMVLIVQPETDYIVYGFSWRLTNFQNCRIAVDVRHFRDHATYMAHDFSDRIFFGFMLTEILDGIMSGPYRYSTERFWARRMSAARAWGSICVSVDLLTGLISTKVEPFFESQKDSSHFSDEQEFGSLSLLFCGPRMRLPERFPSVMMKLL
jgi:hypothetical protein